jgi:CubicO group peptidase (beta-lactamase class C family)
MFTAALVLERVESGALRLDDKLAGSVPEFPNAAAITLDQLLAHSAGVTTEWFDGPILQPVVARDLTHVFSPDEVIELLRAQPPLGAPGASGYHYSNMDYVLLGQVLARSSGTDIGTLMRKDVLGTLPHTTYQFDNPQDLLPGWLEYQGLMLDTSVVPQQSFVSFAGAAGAVHSTVEDLLELGEAMFRDGRVVGEASLAHMMTPAEPGAPYGRGLMRFCPCDGDFSGWGHGGRLPGYFSVVVYYPERDVVIAAMINRDVVSGVPLGPEVFDPTLASVLRALESP